jgi:hypothetical protein
MKKILKVSLALALVGASATAAVAQTDAGSPLGAGGGLSGSVISLGRPGGSGQGGGLTGAGSQGLATARAAFLNAAAGGATVTMPGGVNVTVPQAAAQALGAVLGGNPTPAQINTLTSSLGGVSAPAAGALVRALTSFGASPSHGNLVAAIRSYNAAVRSVGPNAQVPPALMAARSALASASSR